MKIPHSELSFIYLTESADIASFQCNDIDLNGYLKEDAMENQKSRLSVTRLVYWQGNIVGYFTLINDCIQKKWIDTLDGEEGYPYPSYPALKIARLATHNDYERRGIGSAMLLEIIIIALNISDYVGCRILTVDAKMGSLIFYKKYGFKLANAKITGDTIPLYLDFHKLSLEE